MNLTTETQSQNASVLTSTDLLQHWQGHRRLTRKLIEIFPEKEFFNSLLAECDRLPK